MRRTQSKTGKATVGRFTANLLFTYTVRGRSRKRIRCESRLVLLSARSARAAIAAARRYGKKQATSYLNADGELFEFRFLGLIDLIDRKYLEPSEVWYSLFESTTPKARLKPDSRLDVYRNGGTAGDAWFMVPRAWVAPSDQKPVRPARRKRRSE